MFKFLIRTLGVAMAFFIGYAVAANSYRGVEIPELVQSMEDHNLIAITGDREQDDYLFAVTFPQWLADSRDAAAENSTTRKIHIENLKARLENLYTEDPNDSFHRYYKRHADAIKGDRSDRALEVSFCQDPIVIDPAYFYCFGYDDIIYRVIDAVDYLDSENKRIDRAWQYIPYGYGMFKMFTVPGPYGIYPTPKISGMGEEPKIFID